jgi:hypothetical protein
MNGAVLFRRCGWLGFLSSGLCRRCLSRRRLEGCGSDVRIEMLFDGVTLERVLACVTFMLFVFVVAFVDFLIFVIFVSFVAHGFVVFVMAIALRRPRPQDALGS